MSLPKSRLLIIISHPIQYCVPIFRLMAQHPKLEILVAYCSLQGAKPGIDQEFGVEVAWDIPLLDGYPWIESPNLSPKPGLGRFFGLLNLQLWSLMRKNQFDAVLIHTGYVYASFWIVAAAAKTSRTMFMFSTDANNLEPRDRQPWKAWLKRVVLPPIFRLADAVVVSSTLGQQMVRRLGIPEQQIVLAPSAVDNEWWSTQAAQVDEKSVRQQWGVPEDASVVLFCAKLQPWKRPQDILQAFAQADVPATYLVFAGDGSLRRELEVEAEALQVSERVRFLGFVNQSQLPAVYRCADLLVLPSEYEPFGLVVNESMLCRCPVVVSDRVGARDDLIREGETGLVYPCGNVDALAAILQKILPQRVPLTQMGEAAYKRMATWSPREYVEALVQVLENSVAMKRGRT
ncbi:glycosyltransferase family 4 protein [Microcoleus sp. ZQ-A2]|nr:glycosyltransferase family 4 protein [Microcoleus sp. FACHB-1]